MAKKGPILIALVLFLGLVLRLLLVHRVMVGDLLAFVEWGEKVWVWGTKTYYFGEHPWYYSAPNYPPIAALVYGTIDWLWRQKYVTAQLHNLIRFPPAAFIIYFYKYGNVLLYKLLPILSDLGLGLIAFKVTKDLTKSFWKGFGALCFLILNPVMIFVAGAWGQTDSLVALFGILSFIFLSKNKFNLSLFLYFVGMYLKPNWGIFIPFYLYAFYLKRPKLKTLLPGIVAVLVCLYLVSAPFAEDGVLLFTKRMWFDKYIIPVKSVGKASVSAFNFHTIFLKIDRSFFNTKYLGIIQADKLGLIFFLTLNVMAFKFLKKAKNFLWGVMVGLFFLGVGSFLLMANMLERYFFPGLLPLAVIMFTDLKTLVYGILMNLIFLANIIWSFYRRGSDEIDHPFTNNNFLLIRVLSLTLIVSFAKMTAVLLQFKRGRGNSVRSG